MVDIKGSFAVTKVRLAHPNISYVMLFTSDRVILAKVTRKDLQLAPGQTGLAFLAGSAAKGPTEASADDLIAADKDNFGLEYRHISRVRMRKSPVGHMGARNGVIDLHILGMRKATFDIPRSQDYELCRSIVAAAMPDKLQ